MFLFVVSWEDDENTHVNILWPPVFLTGRSPGSRPQSQGLCRGHFLSCAGFLHGHLQPATLMLLWVPLHKNLLGNRCLISTSAMLYPLFSLSMKCNPKITLYCQVAVNCDQESRVIWDVLCSAWFDKVPVHMSSHKQKWQYFLTWKITLS